MMMIGERAELLARLQRYHGLVRSIADSKAREALRVAIAGIERRLIELDREQEPSASRAAARTRSAAAFRSRVR